MNAAPPPILTRLWREEAEPADPFASAASFCHGYDVYGEMLGRSRWADMIYLLLRGEAPPPPQARLLDALAVALANAGPRDPMVHAAMCGGVGGSTAASILMAALAVGAGQLGGGREVMLAMTRWQVCGTDLAAWDSHLRTPPERHATSWPNAEHPPGFSPNGVVTATPVKQTLACFAALASGPELPWLAEQREKLEGMAGLPLSMSGVAAAAYIELGLSPAEGEMLHLLLRLPGAAAHALEQSDLGHKKFPFYANELQQDSEAV
jgi:citrate synthase